LQGKDDKASVGGTATATDDVRATTAGRRCSLQVQV
jgi:hypothetical protein